MRDEEPREGDHDHVVEEDRPAGQEAELVVERAPDEGRGASGLREGGRSLRVRERDDKEEHADSEQHPGGESERLERDDAECEEERGGDLPVRDRGQRRRLENALKTGKLPSHLGA